MKKIIVVAIAVLFVICALIIIISNALRIKSTQQVNKSLFPTVAPHTVSTFNKKTSTISQAPSQTKQTTSSQVNNNSSRNSNNNGNNNVNKDITNANNTNTDSNNKQTQPSSQISSVQQFDTSLFTPSDPHLVSQKDKDNISILSRLIPVNTDDFSIEYSSILNKYIVTTKGAEGEKVFTQWANENGLLETLQNKNIAIISSATMAEIHAQLALTNQSTQNQSSTTQITQTNSQLSPTIQPTQDPQEGTNNSQQQIGMIFNLFSTFFSLSESMSNAISYQPPTLTPSPPIQFPTTGQIPSQPGQPITPPTFPDYGGVNSGNLLPNPLPSISTKALRFKESVRSCLTNESVYKSASAQSGIPWEILVAIHYNEGSCGQNKSLVSGRLIGTNEPDIVRGGGCSSGRSGPGIPIPLATGGCGFNTLLDSAIYAGNHLKGKIGKIPSNFQELAKAFSRYSGGGNSNCGSTPYTYCPELFEGEDDAYVINMFDQKHETMYLVYCADLTKCNPARIHLRPGVATIIRLVTNQL